MPDLTRVAKLANRAAIPGPEEFLTRQPWHRYQSGPFAEIDLARHRLLERTTITRDAMGQRALNFGITPAADPFVGCEVMFGTTAFPQGPVIS
jgi:hypothetical protein